MPSFEYEDILTQREGIDRICGIDEVGTGALAGPVYAAAVIIPRDLVDPTMVAQLNDSKKLSPAKRQELAEWIGDYCYVGLGRVSASECRVGNMTNVRIKAMRQAFEEIKRIDSQVVVGAIVDGAGLALHLPAQPAIYLDKADGLSYSVAAASIYAKVQRDEEMIEFDKKYPGYGWDANKGYGTRVHKAAIEQLGLSDQHRAFGL